jgi:hypothetical protein
MKEEKTISALAMSHLKPCCSFSELGYLKQNSSNLE